MRALWPVKTWIRNWALIFCATIGLSLVAACGEPAHNDRVEEARVTSPDGQFDAIITRENIGNVLGGVYWNVFIVSRGGAEPKDDYKNTLLNASVLRGEKIVWKQNHFLEVRYDIAEIEQFRNLWGSNELEERGWRKGDYAVEIHLVPSSDFSFLNSDGDFRPRE